jgi:hypothetical protein
MRPSWDSSCLHDSFLWSFTVGNRCKICHWMFRTFVGDIGNSGIIELDGQIGRKPITKLWISDTLIWLRANMMLRRLFHIRDQGIRFRNNIHEFRSISLKKQRIWRGEFWNFSPHKILEILAPYPENKGSDGYNNVMFMSFSNLWVLSLDYTACRRAHADPTLMLPRHNHNIQPNLCHINRWSSDNIVVNQH